MINSHLLYRLSYRGTTLLKSRQNRLRLRAVEARHFTERHRSVNPL